MRLWRLGCPRQETHNIDMLANGGAWLTDKIISFFLALKDAFQTMIKKKNSNDKKKWKPQCLITTSSSSVGSFSSDSGTEAPVGSEQW